MRFAIPAAILTLICSLWSVGCETGIVPRYWDYIVVGAGPAGLQLGYFLSKAQRSYVILERANVSGNFFTVYPRHDTLISINKRHTGKTNKEFNLRHDWNSLISDDESLQLRHYTKDFFPKRQVYVKYLNDYTQKLNLNVQYNADVQNIRKEFNETTSTHQFVLKDQQGQIYICKSLVVATGTWKPVIPTFMGVEFTEGYEDVSIDPEDYEGQTVLILGRGNSGFELADGIMGSTNLIHMLSRSRVRLAWATHYVGDLRAINNGLLDTYQLKSLDGVIEASVEEVNITKLPSGKLHLGLKGESGVDVFDNFALRDSYDRIIRCLGFTYDDSMFDDSTMPERHRGRKGKYPGITHDYQSLNIPQLYFAGTITHSLDHRKSAGGFIHGYRYTVRALHHLLEWENHQVPWPSVKASTTHLLNTFLKRVNEASATYQMFGVLGDVIAIRDGGKQFEYFEEFPVQLLADFPKYTGHSVSSVIVLVMEYGANFSGPGKDIFRSDRATGEPSEAHRSNFLHPVFYYYKKLPSAEQMMLKSSKELLPRPDRSHHLVEDFLTAWDGPTSHILPLRRFLEYIFDEDLRHFFAEDCMKMALSFRNLPRTCHENFLKGVGLVGTDELITTAARSGLIW